jgi:hypothetical protein
VLKEVSCMFAENDRDIIMVCKGYNVSFFFFGCFVFVFETHFN